MMGPGGLIPGGNNIANAGMALQGAGSGAPASGAANSNNANLPDRKVVGKSSIRTLIKAAATREY